MCRAWSPRGQPHICHSLKGVVWRELRELLMPKQRAVGRYTGLYHSHDALCLLSIAVTMPKLLYFYAPTPVFFLTIETYRIQHHPVFHPQQHHKYEHHSGQFSMVTGLSASQYGDHGDPDCCHAPPIGFPEFAFRYI